jgi:nickel-dependent lactate racemase
MGSPKEHIDHVRRQGCVAGEHRAYMVARALAGYNIMLVNSRRERFMQGLPFAFYEDMSRALCAAEQITGKDPKIYVIPHSLATIPRQI